VSGTRSSNNNLKQMRTLISSYLDKKMHNHLYTFLWKGVMRDGELDVQAWAQFCCKMWGGQLDVKPI